MNVSSRLLRPAVLAACGLAAILLVTDLLSAQGRRNPRRMATEMVDGHEVVAGEVLLRFRDARRAEFDQANAEVDSDADEVEVVGRRGLRRMHSRRLGARALLAMLRANPEVELVEPNYVIRVDATPNDPSFNNLWGLLNFGQVVGGSTGIPAVDISATLAWEITTGSRANVVGVVDTGIDYNHPDLAANIWTAPAPFTVTIGGTLINCAAGTHGFNAINNTCNPMDDHNHGTHVAGTIGAVGNNGRGVAGVNWTANMMGLKFLSSSGSGSTSDAIKLIDFAIQAKAVFAASGAANVRVLSNSWGGGGYSQSLKDAIDRANASDMLFVAAAGNRNANNDVTPNYPSNYPSANMVAVAATDNRDRRASFSSYGATTVHLGAPGVSILSTTPNNTYAYYNGTSMATPHVAGAAALVLAHCPIPTGDLKRALLSSVDPVAALAGITTTGGRLNADNALRSCYPRVQSVSLTSDLAAPQEAGTLITWTATPSGGVAPYNYKWWIYDGVSWTMATDWTATNTFAWRPATAGTYSIGMWVRSAGNTANAAEVPQSVQYAVVTSARVSVAGLSPNLPSPQPVGTTITWVASQVGGIAPYQYKWWTFNGSAWTAATGWTTANTFAWSPSAVGSAYNVRVWIRSAGNTADAAEASATSPSYVVIASTRVTSVTLTPSQASPQPVGTAVTWTAVPTGGAAPHQYKWMVFDGASWTFVTGWTAASTFAWSPSVPRNYRIGVWVKSAGNTADAAEVPLSVPYTITMPLRVNSVALGADQASPQLLGTSILWTAAPAGGTAPYQYRRSVFNGSAWAVVAAWSPTSTYAWTPVSANLQYAVRVSVRSNGNTSDTAEAESLSAFAITAPPVSSVGLAADRPAPQFAGTTVTWSAAPVGGTAPHQYKWLVFDGTSWAVASAWSANAAWAWKPAQANAAYRVRAWVRSAGSVADAAEASAESGFAITVPPPVSAVALSANRTSPQPVGTAITLTASATGGMAPVQYKWAYFDGTTWNALGAWTTSNVTTWQPSLANAGYTLRVWARSANNAVDAPEASGVLPFAITSTRVTSVAVTTDRPSPQAPGAPVVFTATPNGGIAPHQYKWWIYDGVSWQMATGWTASNTLTWNQATAGSYMIGVWVKSAGNTADAAEVPMSVPYVITAPPRVSGVTIAADRTPPQLMGTTINWTATATGGSAPYQYRWSVYNGSAWTVVTGWSASASYAWTPASGSLQYAVRVSVRSSWNVSDTAEAEAAAAFAITAPPVSAVSITANRTSPQPTGTPIGLTASVTGGMAPIQYKWAYFDGATWVALGTWTTSNTATWQPSLANAGYTLRVWARSAGNTADAPEAAGTLPFAITSLTVTSVIVTPDRASPQAPGTPVVFTAAPGGGIAPHQYKWWIFDGAAWRAATGWTSVSTFTWTPAAAGTYAVGVWAKSAANPAEGAEATQSIAYTIAGYSPPAITQLTLTADRVSPQQPGTTITWTAAAAGGSAPYQYKFALYNGSAWSDLTGWTAQNTYAWTPGLLNSGYIVRVVARSAGNASEVPEATRQVPFGIGTPVSSRVTAVQLNADRASGQARGTRITWTATPTGGIGPHQYKWWIYDGAAWTMATGWTESNTLAWTPSLPGSYLVGVWVKSAGNLSDTAEVPHSVPFVIQ